MLVPYCMQGWCNALRAAAALAGAPACSSAACNGYSYGVSLGLCRCMWLWLCDRGWVCIHAALMGLGPIASCSFMRILQCLWLFFLG